MRDGNISCDRAGYRPQLGHRLAMARNDNFLAVIGPVDQAGQARFGIGTL